MTIHDTHPFADPNPDPVRRFRARVGGVVSLWTAGQAPARAGLTVSSFVVAAGEPARVLGLVDPDSDLRDQVEGTGRAVVALLRWPDRDLAEVFAGLAPAPGGMFAQATFVATPWGPRLERATTWAGVVLESVVDVGWSALLTCSVEHVEVGDEEDPLVHRRGRYQRPPTVGDR
ncbi:MAG: flavin reductase family protein [Nocardioides sp.]|nr:flavin reductase family protein [Nocardioides sp.]